VYIVVSDLCRFVEGVTTQVSLIRGGVSFRASVPTFAALRPSEDEVSASSSNVAYFFPFLFLLLR
jgi:hypothetical protein